MRISIEIKPGRGARRRARRLAVQNPGTHVTITDRHGEVVYDAWVTETGRLSAWIFEHSDTSVGWLRRCPRGR